MKIRQGFVSNSSSSSFIVQYNNMLEPDEIPISDDKVMLLEKFGFWKTAGYYPDQVDRGTDREFTFTEDCSYNYGYDISCNEWDVLEFLIKNEIPFKASCHYEHYYVEYDGQDSIIIARNYGKEIMMYGNLDEMQKSTPVWKTTVDKFLKDGSYCCEN